MKTKIISIAPGRTCLFGDHQDYLGLPIIACAVNKFIKLEAEENDNESFKISMPDIDEVRTINISDNTNEFERGDHFLAALKVLRKHNCLPNRGYDIIISGDLPINSGMSSSSAVVIAWVNFLLEAFGANTKITSELVSQIAYEAEVIEQDPPGGKMDQYSIGLGQILYLETGEDLNYELINKPIEGLIIGESGIPKETIGVLQELKENAWLAIDKIKINQPGFDINRAKVEDLKKLLNLLPENLKSYLYAAITNHDITQKALLEFNKKTLNLSKIGELMNAHHKILKEVLKITVPRIDDMIDAALQSGAYGAKIVGSGRGGSIVALAPSDKKANVIEAIKKAGAKDAYEVAVDLGARIDKSKNVH